MIIRFIVTGKTPKGYAADGMKIYLARLKHYTRFEWIEVEDKTKSSDENKMRQEQGKKIIERIGRGDYVVLLDEKGTEFNSDQFAQFIVKKMNAGVRTVTIIIGGAHGFSPTLYDLAEEKISLSRLTFPHDLVRVIALEQLYRAFTIIKGEGYHHR